MRKAETSFLAKTVSVESSITNSENSHWSVRSKTERQS